MWTLQNSFPFHLYQCHVWIYSMYKYLLPSMICFMHHTCLNQHLQRWMDICYMDWQWSHEDQHIWSTHGDMEYTCNRFPSIYASSISVGLHVNGIFMTKCPWTTFSEMDGHLLHGLIVVTWIPIDMEDTEMDGHMLHAYSISPCILHIYWSSCDRC